MTTENRDGQDGVITLLAGLGVGLLLGGAIALLVAPQAGSQTRAQIRETADEALHRLRDSMDELRTKVEEVANSARDAVGQHRMPGPEALQGGAAGATEDTPPATA